MIDLRSDTVTRPDKPMLEAMMKAPVGDDVFGEDPTVNQLQEQLAALFGHEAGLFCPSGTMTNQIAINVHTRPGDEVICDELSHVYNYEGGGIARNSGASVRLIKSKRGQFTVNDLISSINPSDSHYARTSLLCVEDTSNKGGGAVYQLNELQKIHDFTRTQKLAFHLDGARVFNALAVSGNDSKTYGKLFDSVSVCLSKGLGTPAGSVLLGSRDFIQEAHRTRKVMGGGMRQVGLLAAAGIYALEHRRPLLLEDHRRAKTLESALKMLPWVQEVATVETNIVIFTLAEPITATQCCTALREAGISALPFGANKVRFVTHFDFDDAQLTTVVDRLQDLDLTAP